jgi:Asp-tRNA(Asn)/Glu-tRNA(Gln) amidotransferase A subunit family amidase
VGGFWHLNSGCLILKEEMKMLAHAPLAPAADDLRSGRIPLPEYIDQLCDRIDAYEPEIQSLLPEPGRRERLHREAEELLAKYPKPTGRPPLFGVPVGVKDIFRVDGFPTKAGSQLPAELFDGPEASSVSAIKALGALILGKTVTTEFAYFAPGPTRNPHNPSHTPGGSSSGSAAAVAAGFCPFSLGTQTVGSTIRPAAFCGIVGFKPSYGRIPIDGVIPFSQSVDHVGLFTQDAAGMALAASLLFRDWRPDAGKNSHFPVLGVPEGPFLDQATPEGLAAFNAQLASLERAGYRVVRVEAMADIEEIANRHRRMISAEMAQVHNSWFAHFASLYRPETFELIREGQLVSLEELEVAKAGREKLRTELTEVMHWYGLDLWVSPSALGPAPEGITATGSRAMNLPWTHAGLPTITLPAGFAPNGLPLGLQAVARFMADEQLLLWALDLEQALQ